MNASTYHYYGNIIRTLFLLASIIMLTTLPFFSAFIALPVIFSIFAMLVLSLLAGLTNPVQKYVIILDLAASLFAIIIFEHHAVTQFSIIPTLLFVIDQVLALIFLIAVYYSTKTLRGAMMKNRTIQQQQTQPGKDDAQYRH